MAGAGFRGPLLICLLNLTLIVITFIAVCVEVSCLLKFTTGTNLGSHKSQFGCGGHILYCSRIRKNVTENGQTEKLEKKVTDNRQTEKAITDTTLIIDGSLG